MIRKLAIALSLLGACFTGFVHALGLGEVTVKSALNQPLNAQIELVNTAGLTIDEILPGLATREEFQKANVDRVYFLSDLRFEVITGSNGKAIIVLTSKKPVREPFLNFIVELIWPSGRLLREYALLIDPPLFSEQPATQISAPSVSSKSSGDVLNISSSAPDSSARPLLAPVQKVATGTYGATNSKDTLWDIAIKARPNRSVSPQQVMLAIQDLNPNAFIDNNINKLKAGQVLKLPSVEQIKQRSQHQAIQSVIAQNEALLGKRSPSVVDGSKIQKTTASQKKSVATPTKVTADELKLVVSETNSSTTANTANSGQSNQSGSGAENDLVVTLEKLDKASIENKELNSRVGDLEEQLSTLQRLLTLKNDQLASIQAQMRANELEKLNAQGEEIAEPVQDTSTSVDGTDDAVSNVGLNDENQPSSDIVNTEEADVSENTQALASDGDESEVAAQAELVVPEKVEVVDIDSVKQGDAGTSSGNIIQTIINNPIYLSISLIFVLVIAFVLWMVSKYNANREEEFQTQNTLNSDSAASQFNEGSDEVYDEDAVSFASETHDDEDEFEPSEIDDSLSEQTEDESQNVFSEIEAYISYGRLDQAAQVLEDAISQEPVRTDYRLKLLSVYKELGDRQAFDRQFSELEAIQDSEALSAAEKIKEDLLEEEALQIDLENNESFSDIEDRDEIEEPVAEDDSHESDLSEESVDEEELKSFDFDSVSLEEETEDLDLTSELDLDSLDLETESTDTDNDISLAETSDGDLEEADALDLDLDVNLTADEGAVNEDFDDSILDVDLEDLDLSAELEQETEIALDPELGFTPEVDDSDEELVVSDDILEEATQAFEEGEVADTLDADLSDADDFDFLNGTDEASTKLDLARAYIDMGDIDGAKDILLEVTKEGSEAQQAEAKELLNSID